MRFEIDVTYRCNLACQWCNRLVGSLAIPDCDILIDDIIKSGKSLRISGVKADVVKVSGGEALLHPQLRELCKAIKREWKPTGIRVFTNGILPRGCLKGLKIKWVHSPPDIKQHRPFMISPVDVGFKPREEYPKPCRSMKLCGRSFDAFGFSFCPFAGVIGRIIGVDPYKTLPTSKRLASICQHCIYTVSGGKRAVLEDKAETGGIDYPSKTFAEGLARNKKEPMKMKRFLERLDD